MIVYIVFFLICLFCLLVGSIKSNKNFLMLPFFIVVFLFSGLRGDVGQDTYSYAKHFMEFTSFFNWLESDNLKEPFLYFFMSITKEINSSYTFFLLSISFLQATLLYYISKSLRHKVLFFIFYLLIYYLDFHFNILRASLSVLFFLCALRSFDERRKKVFYLFITLSVLSHLSSVLLFPILILKSKIGVRELILYLFVAGSIIFGVGYFVFGDLISHKISGYGLNGLDNFELRVKGAILILSFVILQFLVRKSSRELFLSSLILVFYYFLSFVFPDIGYRVFYIQFLLILYLLFSKEIFNSKRFLIRKHSLPILVLGCWLAFSSLSFLLNEYAVREGSGKGLLEFTYLPYSFYYESNYR